MGGPGGARPLCDERCARRAGWPAAFSHSPPPRAAHTRAPPPRPHTRQGANAAFEDCLYFTECLDAANGDLSVAVPRFAETRKPETDALAELSLNNYVEMRHKTASPLFLLRKRIEGVLEALLPSTWVPQYSMVAFTRIPYDQALSRAARQDAIVTGLAWGAAAVVGGGLAFALARSAPTLSALLQRARPSGRR